MIIVSILSFCLIGFLSAITNAQAKYDKATFAGGCFWCVSTAIRENKGRDGSAIGLHRRHWAKIRHTKNYAKKGHIEAIEGQYDPSIISYSQLLDVFGGK